MKGCWFVGSMEEEILSKLYVLATFVHGQYVLSTDKKEMRTQTNDVTRISQTIVSVGMVIRLHE